MRTRERLRWSGDRPARLVPRTRPAVGARRLRPLRQRPVVYRGARCVRRLPLLLLVAIAPFLLKSPTVAHRPVVNRSAAVAKPGVLRSGHGSPLTPPPATSTTTSPTPTTEAGSVPATTSVPSSALSVWTKVAVCEEGGWVGSSGPAYPDSLGISAANWREFGGTSDTSPAAQIAVGQRMVAALGIPVPDQAGCAPW